jgi:hypothetical protein
MLLWCRTLSRHNAGIEIKEERAPAGSAHLGRHSDRSRVDIAAPILEKKIFISFDLRFPF